MRQDSKSVRFRQISMRQIVNLECSYLFRNFRYDFPVTMSTDSSLFATLQSTACVGTGLLTYVFWKKILSTHQDRLCKFYVSHCWRVSTRNNSKMTGKAEWSRTTCRFRILKIYLESFRQVTLSYSYSISIAKSIDTLRTNLFEKAQEKISRS